jgi:chromosome segregation ATPase
LILIPKKEKKMKTPMSCVVTTIEEQMFSLEHELRRCAADITNTKAHIHNLEEQLAEQRSLWEEVSQELEMHRQALAMIKKLEEAKDEPGE